ncbi:MAG: hypothetical protein IJP94_01095, partial [Clostridia bacterium]|nr:hypothetical protein [Clostridia bacterium]
QENNDVYLPTKINIDAKIVSVSAATGVNEGFAGYTAAQDEAVKADYSTPLDLMNRNLTGAHVLALDENGNVWAWGLNNKGQIGNAKDVTLTQNKYGYESSGYHRETTTDTDDDTELHEEYNAESRWAYIPEPFHVESYTDGDNTVYYTVDDNFVVVSPQIVAGLEGTERLSSIVEIAAGGNSSVAVRADGYVYAWGDNSKGQLGINNSSISRSLRPMQVTSGEKSASFTYFRDGLYVDMATDHAVISTRGHEAYAWGANNVGQLGNGGIYITAQSPVKVLTDAGTPLTDIIYVSAAGSASYAVTENGENYSWGSHANGQLGIGGDNTSHAASSVYATNVLPGETSVIDNNSTTLQKITRSFPGETDSMAMRYDGSVYGWGYTGVGLLLSNVYEPIFQGETPAKIFGFQEYAVNGTVQTDNLPNYLYLNNSETLRLTLNGANGMIDKEYLGFNLLKDVNPHPTTDFSSDLVFSSSNEQLVTVTRTDDGAGNYYADITVNHARRYGEAVITAKNDVTGYYGTFVIIVKPDGDVTAPMVVSTNSAIYALKSDGTLWTWGTVAYPVQVKKSASENLTGIKYVAAGDSHVLAVTNDGNVYAWGDNTKGKLGIGGTTAATYPTLVKGIGGTGNLSGIERVAAGAVNSAAIGADGVVYVWGDNTYGQKGIELKASQSTSTSAQYSEYPAYTVKGASAGDNVDGALNDFIDITITDRTISALRRDGNVFSWGDCTYGQIGKGLDNEALAPTQAAAAAIIGDSITDYLRNIIDLSSGSNHILALRDNGEVYAWGSNSNNQLGIDRTVIPDGATAGVTKSNRPVKVQATYDGTTYVNLGSQAGTKAVNVMAGKNSSLAVGYNGFVYAWGQANNNQLGLEVTSDTFSPTYVNRGESFYDDDVTTTLGWVTNTTINGSSASAVRYDGSIYSWGLNSGTYYGAGDYSGVNRATPVQTGLREDRAEVVDSARLYTNGTITTTYDSTNPLPQKITLTKEQYIEIDKANIYDNHMVGFNAIYDDTTDKDTQYPAEKQSHLDWYDQFGMNGAGGITVQSVYDGITATSIDTSLVSVSTFNGGSYTDDIIRITPNDGHRYASTYITLYNTLTNYVGVLEVSVKELGTNVMPMIVSGDNHTLALRSDGTVWAWGSNTYGQLGNGIRSNDAPGSHPAVNNEERNDFEYPVKVNIPDGVVIKSIAAGKRHSLALTENGNVYIWGYTEPINIVWGDYYQRNIVTKTGHDGNTSYEERVTSANQNRRYGIVTPVLVKLNSDSTKNLSDVISIAAGDDVSYAVKSDGTVWSWGNNGPTGKLGINRKDSLTSEGRGIGGSSWINFEIPAHWEYNEWRAADSYYVSTPWNHGWSYTWYLWSEYGTTGAQQ